MSNNNVLHIITSESYSDSRKSVIEELNHNTLILNVNQMKVHTTNLDIICCDTHFIQTFFFKRCGKHKYYDKRFTFTSSFNITVHLITVTVILTTLSIRRISTRKGTVLSNKTWIACSQNTRYYNKYQLYII